MLEKAGYFLQAPDAMISATVREPIRRQIQHVEIDLGIARTAPEEFSISGSGCAIYFRF